MATYSVPDFVAKPKPRLDHRGFREQGTKVADDRIKRLKTQLSWLDNEVIQLRTDQQRVYTTALRELEETTGLQHSSDFDKNIDQGNLKDLIPKVVQQFDKTKSALMKEKPDSQNLGAKTGQFLRNFSSVKETRIQKLYRKEIRKKSAILKKNKLSDNLRELQKKLKASRQENNKLKSPESAPVDASENQVTNDEEEDLQLKMELLNGNIASCVHKIKKLNSDIVKLKQLNQADDKKMEELEQVEDENMKSIRKMKENQEMEEIQDQENRKKKLRDLEKDIWSIRARSNDPYELRSRNRLRRLRRIHKMIELGELGDDYYSRRYLRGFLMSTDRQSDSSDESTDTETQETVNGNCVRWLERQIGDAQALEEYIERLQHDRQRLEGLESLKDVLKYETLLEQEWLKRPNGSTSLELPRPAKDHLSGGHFPDDEIYNPLRPDEFRVLILLPAPDPCFPLVCKLEKWSMRDVRNSTAKKKEYLALSYFWGPDVCNGRIYLLSEDDQDVPGLDDRSHWGTAMKRATQIHIRNNLFRALLRLRRTGTNAQAVSIWVDFLSIKQKDVKEKTAQLDRMVDIYSNASQVCIWLGESDSGGRSDKAMDFIHIIMDFAMFERYAGDKAQADRWYALGELMRDRWFSRRWVVQEMVLAKDATVHCGDRVVRWSDFADAAALLVSNQERIKSLFDVSDWREGQNTLGTVESFGAWILLESTSNLFRRKPNGDIKRPIKPIEYLVTSLKTFDTGNTRDLIYSLVSIASDTSYKVWHHDKTNAEEQILARDYNKSEIAVYQEFTKFCVRTSRSLDVICRPWAMAPEEQGTLPSWIPLLAKSEFGAPEEAYTGRKNGDNLVGPAGSPTYEASGKFQHDPVFETQGPVENPFEAEILVAKGLRLAKINKRSPRNTGGVILRESLKMIGWEGFQRDSNSVPSEVWRTLVADRDFEGRIAPSWYQRACLRCLEIAHMFSNGDLNVGEILQGHSDMLLKYLRRVQNVTWNRRFFTAVECEGSMTEDVDHVSVQSSSRCSDVSSRESEEVKPQGEAASQGDQDEEAGEIAHEDGVDAQNQEGEQIETQHEGALSGHEASPRTTEDTDIDRVQTEGVHGENGDDHLNGGLEVAVSGTNVKDENETIHGVEKNEDTESVRHVTEDEKIEDPGVDEQEADGKKNDDKETDGKEVDDKEDSTHGQAAERETQEKDADVTSVSDDSNDEESAKGESSEPDVTEDEVTDAGTSAVEESGMEESEMESSMRDQGSMTYSGLCPPETEDGDFICILYGCSVPVVLREMSDEGHMILIGEAYVHGKMDGEAMEDSAGKDPEIFYIH
ncbi:ankyrin and het domain [Fusarium sporotrichioides]|uniref:Ankyrin and het domain n=1 Tax=Fusarium sporotrichioides TaxID=5514 RepID=A0A395RW15_FUSSP|nr:ankyrin and het domain [Fusarium sporotrichioides]